MASEPTFGIHLNFTNNISIVSVSSIKVVCDPKGNYKIPFYVAFTDTNVLIGEEALEYGKLDPENCIYDIGKFIERKYNDEELLNLNKDYRFKLVNEEGVLKVTVKYLSIEKSFPISYILSMYLHKLIKTSLEYTQIDKISGIVLTVPDSYKIEVRQEIEAAVLYTQYKLIGIISENYAIKLAYGVTSLPKNGPKTIVCHLTQTTSGMHLYYEDGNFHVPFQTNISESITKYCVEHFKEEFGCDITKNEYLMDQVKKESKKVIQALVTSNDYTVKIDNTLLQATITREQFDALNEGDFINDLKDILNSFQEVDGEVSHVLFAGSYSLIPCIRQLFLEAFEERKLLLAAVPDLVVSHGAAIHAATATNPSKSIYTVTLMKYSAKLNKPSERKEIHEPETPNDDETESIVVIHREQVHSEPESIPKNNDDELKSTALQELSNNLLKFKEQVDDVTSYLAEDAKQIADDHFAYLTKWMIDCENVADFHVIQRQQKHLESIMDPLIQAGKLAKESADVLESLVNDEYANKKYTNALKLCNKILSLKHWTDDETMKWEKFRSKILFEQQESEKFVNACEKDLSLVSLQEPKGTTLDEQEEAIGPKSTHDRETIIVDILKASEDDNYDIAIKICNEALLQFPLDEEILYFRAHSLKEIAKHRDAIRDFTQVIQQNPGNANAFMHRGECYQNCKIFKEALDDFQHCIQLRGKRTKSLDSLIAKTKFQSKLKDIDEYIEENNFKKAADLMINLEETYPAVVDDDLTAEFFMKRAEILYHLDNIRGAVKDVNSILNNYPEGSLQALKLRAKCYESEGDYEAAVEDLNKIHEMEPTEENQLKWQRLKKRNGLLKKQEYFKSQYNVKLL